MAVRKMEKPAVDEPQELGGRSITREKDASTLGRDAGGGVSEEVVRLAYIGPTLPSGQARSNQIFIGTMEKIKAELKDALEAYPLAWKLMVPVAKMGEKKAQACMEGTALNKYYSCIVSEIEANKAKEG